MKVINVFDKFFFNSSLNFAKSTERHVAEKTYQSDTKDAVINLIFGSAIAGVNVFNQSVQQKVAVSANVFVKSIEFEGRTNKRNPKSENEIRKQRFKTGGGGSEDEGREGRGRTEIGTRKFSPFPK